MAKGRYFSLRGDAKILDSQDLGKRLKKQILDNAEDFVNDEVNFIVDRLEQLLSDIELAVTSAPDNSTQTPTARKEDNEFLTKLHYSLLNLQ